MQARLTASRTRLDGSGTPDVRGPVAMKVPTVVDVGLSSSYGIVVVSQYELEAVTADRKSKFPGKAAALNIVVGPTRSPLKE
jgi:hypothetical protein